MDEADDIWCETDTEIYAGEAEGLEAEGEDESDACFCGEDDCPQCEDTIDDDDLGFWWS